MVKSFVETGEFPPNKKIADAIDISPGMVTKDISTLIDKRWLIRDNKNNLLLNEEDGPFLKNTNSARYFFAAYDFMDENTKIVDISKVQEYCVNNGISEDEIKSCHEECVQGGYLKEGQNGSFAVNIRIYNEEKHYLENLRDAQPQLKEFPGKGGLK